MGLSGFFHRNEAGQETPVAVENATETAAETAAAPAATPQTQAESPEIARLRAEMAERDRKIHDLEAKAKADEARRVAESVAAAKAAGRSHAAGLVKANKLLPAGARHLADLHAYAHLAAAGLPTEGLDPVAAVAGLEAGLAPHHLTAEALAKLPDGHEVLTNGSAGADADEDAKVKAANDKFFAARGVARPA